MTTLQKPFLKWVGGKTQIINPVISKFPEEIENYHEPFLGGGSVLLSILSLQKQGKIKINGTLHAYDLNNGLINVYKNIQSNKDELYTTLKNYYSEYDGIAITPDQNENQVPNRNPKNLEEAKTSKESYYYFLRTKFNTLLDSTDSIECSALFMFLNKTCFRGMYREGPNGFNVPYGHYKTTPKLIPEDELSLVSELIKDVKFNNCCFKESLENVTKGDLVYLDPPYAPESKTSFVGYTQVGFSLESHLELFEKINTLNKNGVKIVMSNSSTDLVISNLPDFHCEAIKARRAINSKNPGSTTTEVIVYN